MSSASQRLAWLLALDDEQLLQVLGADALELISGDADALPEVPILLALLNEAEQRVGQPTLARWVRTTGPSGTRPLDLLLARDFAAFEDALVTLAERGFIIRG